MWCFFFLQTNTLKYMYWLPTSFIYDTDPFSTQNTLIVRNILTVALGWFLNLNQYLTNAYISHLLITALLLYIMGRCSVDNLKIIKTSQYHSRVTIVCTKVISPMPGNRDSGNSTHIWVTLYLNYRCFTSGCCRECESNLIFYYFLYEKYAWCR